MSFDFMLDSEEDIKVRLTQQTWVVVRERKLIAVQSRVLLGIQIEIGRNRFDKENHGLSMTQANRLKELFQSRFAKVFKNSAVSKKESSMAFIG